MDPQNNLKQLQDLFNQAKDILIITRPQPSVDGICASLGLYHALSSKTDMQGKKKRVVVASSGRGGSQYAQLPGFDKIVSELGLRDLVIGINGYTEGAIENVNWYVDRGRLNVVFKSNPVVPMQFDLKNLDPFYAGANFDVVVVVDANNPADLGNAYRQDPGMFSELPVVNISNNQANTRFGRVNIVDPNVPSISELAYQLTQILQIMANPDTATLFLTGIKDATNNLQNKGQQTDPIVSQLGAVGARQLDLESVRADGAKPPLPVTTQPPVMPQQGGVGAYPPQGAMPVGQYPYPPQGYGQMPPQAPYYPPYPQQAPPPNGMYPNTYQPNPYQNQPYQYPPTGVPVPPPYYPPQEGNTQSPLVEQPIHVQNPGYDIVQDVPSFAHDQTQSDSYIPTVEPTSYQHVAPSLDMPNVNDYYAGMSPTYPQTPQQPTPPVPQHIEEQKEQKNAPDFTQPPQGFIPGEKRG
jgi:hypothetical protein